MNRTRQIAIEDRKNSLSKSIFRLIEAISKVKTMNQTLNIFESQIMKAIKVSTQQKLDYAILQIELNQFEQKRKRIELLRKIEKTKAIKIVEFFEIQLAFLMNRIMIDKLQKKKFFKIMNSKKYKNSTQHDLNIFIRECWKVFEIRRHIYFDDKNKIFFVKSFFEMYRRRIEKNIKKSLILFHFLKTIYWFFTKTSQFETFAIARNKCQIKKNSTAERTINDRFDCLFQ
jgi:hypothetical protein